MAIAQANERVAQASKLAEKIDAIKARQQAAKPAPDLLPEKPAKTKAEDAQASLIRAREEARKLREQAVTIEFQATLAWLEASDLTPQVLPVLGEDPRQSEIDARDRAVTESRRRARLASILESAKQAKSIEDRADTMIPPGATRLRWLAK